MQLKLGVFLFVVTACAQPEDSKAYALVDTQELTSYIRESRTKPLVLNFWATWCTPCVEEMPDLALASKEAARYGVETATISFDLMIPEVDFKAIRQRVAALQKNWVSPLLVFYFDEPDYHAIGAALDLPGPIPLTIAFDAKGAEIDRIEGKASMEGFKRLFAAARNSLPKQ